jgi:hypothetical protein
MADDRISLAALAGSPLPELLAQFPPSVAVIRDQLRHQASYLGRPTCIATVIEQADRAGSGAKHSLAVAVGALHSDASTPDRLPPRQIRINLMAISAPQPTVAMLVAAVPFPQRLVLAGLLPLLVVTG